MNKIKEYKVVSHSNIHGLSSLTNEHISVGWQPCGGVKVVKDCEVFFIQAMVKYEVE